MTPEVFCREIEAYLTRKNDGHLVRIVGPSFERVMSWSQQGVPLKVALAGIDRHFERYYSKGPRRRPVRIDHCEADVLDIFDEWRRAVGITAGLHSEPATPPRHRDSLVTSMERAVARLTALRSSSAAGVPEELLSEAVSEIDRLIPVARTARGAPRDAIIERLRALDRELLSAARARVSAEQEEQLKAQADEELRPFAERMPAVAWQQATASAIDRALRDRTGLPDLTVV